MAEGVITGVNGILVWTENLGPMAEFYRDTLGLEARSVRERLVNFVWGDFRLTLAVHDDVHGRNEDPDRLMINLSVDDIHAAYDRLKAAGVVFTRPPEQEPWGGWIATFHDPDGNTLQLLQP